MGEQPMTSRKTPADFRRLPYRRRVDKVVEEGQQSFVAFIDEIPWIRAHEADPVAALKALDDLFDDAIESMLLAGDDVPEPPTVLEAYGTSPEKTRIADMMDMVRQAVTGISGSSSIKFVQVDAMQPWQGVTIPGEEKLVPANEVATAA
jgi:hypothetical protein